MGPLKLLIVLLLLATLSCAHLPVQDRPAVLRIVITASAPDDAIVCVELTPTMHFDAPLERRALLCPLTLGELRTWLRLQLQADD